MSEPQTFGKYRLVRRLAFGGMAEIFLARLVGDQGFEKTVVLKRILPQLSSDPDFTRMFIDEAVLAARLTHPNVAQVYDFGEVDGTYFITMEHVDGADLRKVIRAAADRNRGLTAVDVAAIGEAMARGLAYVHDLATDDGKPLSIVHRDVSPHNVMLTRGGDVKVMDFGIAKAAARATHTATGTIKGKLAYMAPEQALAEELDKRVDQYAVGLTLWECLTGRRVFEGDSEPELLSRVAAGRVPDLRTTMPEVPEALSRIIMRMLSLARADRYPDLRDVEQELAAFRFGLGAAGVARLSGLVDELVPREPARPATPERVTAVLPADGSGSAPTPQPMSTSSHSAAQADLSMEQGWPTSVGSTAPTFEPPAAPPTRAVPTVINPPRRSPVRLLGLLGVMAAVGVGVGFATRRGEGPATDDRPPLSDNRPPTPEVRLPTSESPPVTTGDRPATEDQPPQAEPRHSKAASAKAAHGKGTGFVSLRSRGSWAEVFMNGKSLGNTPLRRVEVPAGIVTLELRGAGGGLKTLTLDVPAGDHVQRTIEIR